MVNRLDESILGRVQDRKRALPKGGNIGQRRGRKVLGWAYLKTRSYIPKGVARGLRQMKGTILTHGGTTSINEAICKILHTVVYTKATYQSSIGQVEEKCWVYRLFGTFSEVLGTNRWK
jgi:hypothetical protein